MKMRSVIIRSVATCFPEKRYSNDHAVFDALEKRPFYWDSFWGIKERGFFDWKAGEDETSAALMACERALKLAQCQGVECDLVLSSCSFPIIFNNGEKRLAPRLSSFLRNRLSIKRGIDVQDDCLSFLANLEFAASMIVNGVARRVLVCSSEFSSASLDMIDPMSSVFGDGAVAMVLEQDLEHGNYGVMASHFISSAEHYKIALGKFKSKSPHALASENEQIWPYFDIEKGAPLKMQTFVPFMVPKVIKRALKKCDLGFDDIDHYVFHQPSSALVKAWAKGVGAQRERYTTIMDKHAVMVSSSIPATLHQAIKQGVIGDGSHIILAGAATGWNFGAQVWKVSQIAI